jgi:hypothetical protein
MLEAADRDDSDELLLIFAEDEAVSVFVLEGRGVDAVSPPGCFCLADDLLVKNEIGFVIDGMIF